MLVLGCSHRDQLVRERGEAVRAVGGHEDHVLYTHPELARNVDPGLDGHDVPCVQPRVDLWSDPRRFVDLEPHAVAGAVPEQVALSRPLDLVAGRRVHGLRLCTRGNGCRGRRLGRLHQLVYLPCLSTGIAVARVRVQSEQ